MHSNGLGSISHHQQPDEHSHDQYSHNGHSHNGHSNDDEPSIITTLQDALKQCCRKAILFHEYCFAESANLVLRNIGNRFLGLPHTVEEAIFPICLSFSSLGK